MAEAKKTAKCITCKHGKYMQWFKNPIICECTITKERQVAEVARICPLYEMTPQRPEVTHYDSY